MSDNTITASLVILLNQKGIISDLELKQMFTEEILFTTLVKKGLIKALDFRSVSKQFVSLLKKIQSEDVSYDALLEEFPAFKGFLDFLFSEEQ